MDFLTALSIIEGIGMLILGYLAWKSKYGDSEKLDGKQSGQLISDIGYVKSGVDDIKRKQEKQDEQHLDVICRIVAVEGSSKQAHHRIDTIEENIRSQGQYNGKGLE